MFFPFIYNTYAIKSPRQLMSERPIVKLMYRTRYSYWPLWISSYTLKVGPLLGERESTLYLQSDSWVLDSESSLSRKEATNATSARITVHTIDGCTRAFTASIPLLLYIMRSACAIQRGMNIITSRYQNQVLICAEGLLLTTVFLSTHYYICNYRLEKVAHLV